MNKNELIKFIEESLRKRRYNIKITADLLNKPIRDIKIDSLLAFSVIMDLEQRLKVQIPDEKLMQVKTLNDLIALFSK